MRVLIWISQGFLEDLARVATRNEKNMDLVGVTTEVDEVERALLRGDVDVLLLGISRLQEWTKLWTEGVLADAPTFCPIVVSTLPLSAARLMEVGDAGIFDVVDLTMDRDVMGQRLIDGYRNLRRRHPESTTIIEKRINETAIFRLLSDETDRKIVSLVARGKFDKEIASELFLSLQTIRNRLSRILAEFGARNRTHLALMFTNGVQADDVEDTTEAPDDAAQSGDIPDGQVA